MNRQVAERQGRRAETIAAWWLRLHGWSILARRARVAGGEVDLVARRGHVLAFVEVKQRATGLAAAWWLDDYRLRCVAAAAERLALRSRGRRPHPHRRPVHRPAPPAAACAQCVARVTRRDHSLSRLSA